MLALTSPSITLALHQFQEAKIELGISCFHIGWNIETNIESLNLKLLRIDIYNSKDAERQE